MKSNFFEYAAFVLLLVVMTAGCKNNEKDSNEFEIPFSEYSTENEDGIVTSGLDISWNNLKYDNKVIIVNSSEEMKKYIPDDIGNHYDIDFSKFSLLLASGKTNSGIFKRADKFWQISKNEYRLDVEIELNDATIVQSWHLALLTDKLYNDSKISLNLIIK